MLVVVFNVNGHISNSFKLSRGVRQGYPLSPLLYVLVAEALAYNIRSNGVISGLSLPGSPCSLPVVSPSADDTTLGFSVLLFLVFWLSLMFILCMRGGRGLN